MTITAGVRELADALDGRQSPGFRLLAHDGRPVSLAQHEARYGPVPWPGTGGRLIDEVAEASLTGRGGAGFPTAVKMAAVADAAQRARRAGADRRPVVVANGAEGEPASRKDKELLWQSPHLVLDGLQLAADAVGAWSAFVYLHRGDRLRARLTQALAERAAAGWDRIAPQVVAAPPRFLAGQETALVSRIAGGLALPRFTPPRVFERGVGGAPTLVQNVETLAHVALIARHGAAWFRQAGTAAEPGTMLVTRYLADGAAGVAEVAIGTSLRSVLGLAAIPAQAVLTGGYHGAWVRGGSAAGLLLATASLRPAGGVLGAGVLAALPADRCGLAEAARVVGYLAAESAGQCGPCLAGLPRISATLRQASLPGSDPGLVDQLERWSGLVAKRGACAHPDGTVRFVRSTLTVFAQELALHRRGECIARAPGGTGEPFLPVPAGAPQRRDDWR
jgi:NADH:ubiquinone oxidoreductase subunit F (NADH-binding)